MKTRASGTRKKKLAIYILYWLLERAEWRCLTVGATLNQCTQVWVRVMAFYIL